MNNGRSLLTTEFKINSGKNFIDSVSNNQYYFFVGNHIDANTGVSPFENTQDIQNSSYFNMIFGKKINNQNVMPMIRRIDWQSNTVYDIYDHRDSNLYNKNFYVMVQEGTNWNVFKCLENGNGAPSVVSPSITNVSSSGDDFYFPTDGYRWKYMYSIDDADFGTFATSDYFPVKTDLTTQSQAIPGSITTIDIVSPGRGYNNYFSGTFGITDIRLNGDPKKYGISNTGINTTNGFYDGCWLYVSSGPGAGQFKLVNQYVSNSTFNYMVLDNEFDPTDSPQNGSTFELYPSVTITGDGRETLPAFARAIVDPASGNTVSRIEIIERGENYFHATANILASSVVGVTSIASVVPIMSPINGHGYDPISELGGTFVGLSVSLVGSEGNTIVTDNDYSQIGIIRNPLFNSVEMTLSNQNQDFFTDEVVYKISKKQLYGSVQTTLDANNQITDTVTISGIDGPSVVDVGSTIVLNYSNNFQIANVLSVTNTDIQFDQNILWSTETGSANIHLATITATGTISGFATGSVILTNANGIFQSGDELIGSNTGVHAYANVVTITGVTKTFDTFRQLFEYSGTITHGSFIQDEQIYRIDDPNANAFFHSAVQVGNTSTYQIYTSDQWGVFNTDASTNQVRGATSGAIATITNKYLPDLVYGSGDIVYVEYGDSVTRTNEKEETFRIIFSF